MVCASGNTRSGAPDPEIDRGQRVTHLPSAVTTVVRVPYPKLAQAVVTPTLHNACQQKDTIDVARGKRNQLQHDRVRGLRAFVYIVALRCPVAPVARVARAREAAHRVDACGPTRLLIPPHVPQQKHRIHR
eukprot:560846-Rhodomonas_salina.1